MKALFRSQVDTSQCDFTCEDHCRSFLQSNWSQGAAWDSIPTQAQVDSCVSNNCSFSDSLVSDSTEMAEIAQAECDALYKLLVMDISPGGWMYDSLQWLSVGGDSTLIDSVLQNEHREYCHWQACMAEKQSRTFDRLMAMVPDWDAADTLGYLNPLHQSTPSISPGDIVSGIFDPWFDTGANGEHMLAEMKDSLEDYHDDGTGMLTLWEFVDTLENAQFYSSCAGDTECIDTMSWQIWHAIYLGEKTHLQTRYRTDSLNCPYYADLYAHVKEPIPVALDTDSISSWNSAQMGQQCLSQCQANVDYWMIALADSFASIDSSDTLLRNALMDYCLGSCGFQNPFGLITQDAIDAGLLDSVQSLLGVGEVLDSMHFVGDDPYSIATDTTGDTLWTQCIQFSPCYMALMNFINSALVYDTASNTYSIPDTIWDLHKDPMLANCFPGDTAVALTSSGINLVGAVSGGCAYLMFLDDQADGIDAKKLISAGLPNYTVGPGIEQPSGSDTVYQNMQVNLTVEGSSGDSTVAAYVYIDTASGCGTSLLPVVDSCYVVDSLNEDTLFLLEYNLRAERDTCIARLLAEAEFWATEAWKDSVANHAFNFERTHRTRCLEDPFKENFKMRYRPYEYGFTLYYYDQAGNLVQTVPPEGVDLLDTTDVKHWTNGTSQPSPGHGLLTRYKYDSPNQVRWQDTPDGGETDFYYDDKGQLRLSQNDKQGAASDYSYTMYDDLGRITEVGEMQVYSQSVDTDSLNKSTFPANVHGKLDITRTYYDKPFSSLSGIQENLRGRVSYVTREDTLNDWAGRTFYSYDFHGNVNHLRHTIPGLGMKYMDYEYDLVSGNVNRFVYQKGKEDQWIHEYEYDSDNRIRSVSTSMDGVIWDRDARYFYYPHGPLARVETGEDLVQGSDYYYTLQGWLKGINVAGLRQDKDPGLDGHLLATNLNQWAARDEYAVGLGYNELDYRPITASTDLGAMDPSEWANFQSHVLEKSYGTSGKYGMFNGNIVAMATMIDPYARTGMLHDSTQLMLYQYDQMNRLRNAYSYSGWARDSSWTSKYDSAYNVKLQYDYNGNITSLVRHGGFEPLPACWSHPANFYLMDSLEYHYPKSSGKLTSNRLKDVVDHAAGTTASDNACPFPTGDQDHDQYYDGDYEVEPDGDTGTDMFLYDATGNLIKDQRQNLDSIHWDVYGKISYVDKYDTVTDNTDLVFQYDGLGNRILKEIRDYTDPDSNTYYYYVRDAQGNIIALYEKTLETGGWQNTYLRELTIYGSERVGLCKPDLKVDSNNVSTPSTALVGPQQTIFTGILYDSPSSPPQKPASNETHLGEYIVILNTTNSILQLEDLELHNYANSEKVTFASTDSLLEHQHMVIAYGNELEDQDGFIQRTMLDEDLLSDSDLKWKWQTSMSMEDGYGDLRLLNIDGDDTTLVEAFVYGETAGFEARNGYVPDSLLDSLAQRERLLGAERTSYNTSPPPSGGGEEANPPGTDMQQFYTATYIGGIKYQPKQTDFKPGERFDRLMQGKNYEMKNHLGNVLTVISDLKLGQDPDPLISPDTVDYYLTDLVQAQDYYPFGMIMPRRKYSSPDYRYGFNGQEKDDEVHGNGNSIAFKYRVHDPRLGRFFSVDPYAKNYPWYSTYQFAGNKPINSIDLEGLEEFNVVRTKSEKYDLNETEIILMSTEKVKNSPTGIGIHWHVWDDELDDYVEAGKSTSFEANQEVQEIYNKTYWEDGKWFRKDTETEIDWLVRQKYRKKEAVNQVAVATTIQNTPVTFGGVNVKPGAKIESSSTNWNANTGVIGNQLSDWTKELAKSIIEANDQNTISEINIHNQIFVGNASDVETASKASVATDVSNRLRKIMRDEGVPSSINITIKYGENTTTDWNSEDRGTTITIK